MNATIADLLAAAEPVRPRDLGGLMERLRRIDPTTRFVGGRADGSRSSAESVSIHGVVSDSRRVTRGSLFVAVPGLHADGHAFVDAAIAAGAAAVVVERDRPDLATPQVVVRTARRALAEAAAWWYGDPSRELGVIGITGTDGKTTTSLLAAAALSAAGQRPGLVGTVAAQIGGVREPNPDHSTTPEAPQLQQALRAMVAAGDTAAVIETTSHGLALDRVAAIAYDIALFTNLSHEQDRKSTRLNSSHIQKSRMPSSA